MRSVSTADQAQAAGRATERKGGTFYFTASVVGQAVALLRYVILARLLGPEQLGLSATLVVTGTFFDLISDTASDRFLIQDLRGDEPGVQSLVHFVYVTRGLMVAAALVILAVPLAAFYRAPQLAVGFVAIGLTRLVEGFGHLDLRRVQRTQDFRPEAINILVSEITGLLVITVAALIVRDFTAVLYGLGARSLVSLLFSHLSAKRPYQVSWSREHGPRLVRFSAPLIISGMLLFVSTQGDRVFVANQMGPRQLGEYSATILLIYSPCAIILRYMHAIYVPMIARHRDNIEERDRESDNLGGQTLLLAVAMAVGFAIVAPFMVKLLYGARFAQSLLLVGLAGILTTTRFLINWPTTVALSLGRSRTVLYSNLAKLSVFPLAFAGLRLIGGLTGAIYGFILGEMLSIAIALMFLSRDSRRPFWTGFDRLASFISTAVVIVGWDEAISRGAHPAVFVSLVAISAIQLAWLVSRERRVLIDAGETTLAYASRR